MAPKGGQQTLKAAFASSKAKGKGKGAASSAPEPAAPSKGLPPVPKLVGVTLGFSKEHDDEGRVITVEYDEFYLVNVYVVNSGMKLERLEHRLKKVNSCGR